ncbi:MAG: efflux RND transporter periplasmic adaptor subunit [Verrucomicrobiota bacterium]|nr:efflux RND transporter periplasmic adaptor subunit [Verrucomicrobiota bacterium]
MKKINIKFMWMNFLLCAAFICAGCKHEEKQAAQSPPPKIEGDKIAISQTGPQASGFVVESAEARKNTSLLVNGKLIWNDDATVRVFSPVAGRVNKIDAQLGQKISAGAPLVKILSPDFGQAQADARKALVDLQIAERTRNRVKELHEHGAAPQKDFDSAEADYTRAVSEKQRTAARLALYGGDDSTPEQTFCLKAPIAGTVVEKNINSGQEVRPDAMMSNVPQYAQPLFVISDPSTLWLQLDVSEQEMALLKPGQKLRVQSRAYPEKFFEGRIEIIGDSLEANTRTVKVRAVVDNSERLLKAEMYVSAEVVLDLADNEKSGVEVSSKAVFLKDNQHFIFIENAPGQFERHVVKLGGESHGRVFIQEGLNVGQKVVTEGSLLLQALLDGEKS